MKNKSTASLTPLANEAAPTSRSPQFWKRKLSLAIGRPELENAPDEVLDEAHDKHQQLMQELGNADENVPTGAEMVKKNMMPPGPASVQNEKQRIATARLLVNQAVGSGMSYTDAFNTVLNSRPELFKGQDAAISNIRSTTPLQNKEEIARREQFLALVNEKTERGADYDTAFRMTRAERPDLINTPSNRGSK